MGTRSLVLRISFLTTTLVAALLGVASPAMAVDTAPPQVNFKSPQYVTGTLLSDTTDNPAVPMKAFWTVYDPSGLCYQSARVYDSFSQQYYYPTIRQRANGTYFIKRAVHLQSYISIQLTLRDCVNNQGTASDYIYGGHLYQETAASLSPGWTNSNCLCWSGYSAFWNTQAQAKASFSFYGRAIAWITNKADNRGSAQIFIDGKYQTTVNLQAAGVNRIVGFQKRFASDGSHVLDVVVVGTAGHPRVDIDAFIVN